MKPRKDFKSEFDQDFADASYAANKVSAGAVAWIIAVALILGVFGAGARFLKTNADRLIFKQSVTYNEGMLDDLAKYKYEYDCAEDDTEKGAIASLVRNRFANFDKSKIENSDLRKFLRECGV